MTRRTKAQGARLAKAPAAAPPRLRLLRGGASATSHVEPEPFAEMLAVLTVACARVRDIAEHASDRRARVVPETVERICESLRRIAARTERGAAR